MGRGGGGGGGEGRLGREGRRGDKHRKRSEGRSGRGVVRQVEKEEGDKKGVCDKDKSESPAHLMISGST